MNGDFVTGETLQELELMTRGDQGTIWLNAETERLRLFYFAEGMPDPRRVDQKPLLSTGYRFMLFNCS